jgi:hypothetical protein
MLAFGTKVRLTKYTACYIKNAFYTHTHTHTHVYVHVYVCIYMCIYRRRVSSGSKVSDYGLDDRAIGVRFPAAAKYFSSILCVQTGSGDHPASCTMGTGGPFPGDKSAAGACR